MRVPPAVILAGGRADRMGGGDKCLQPLAGRPILAHVLDRLAPQVSALVLSANGDAARFAAFGLAVVADKVPGQPGPLAGLLAGLDWAADQGADLMISVAADAPFLPDDLVAGLAAEGATAIAASPDETGRLRRHPVVGLWQVSARDDLRRALADGLRKVGLWADRQKAATVAWDGREVDPFFNVNRLEDLARAEALLAQPPLRIR